MGTQAHRCHHGSCIARRDTTVVREKMPEMLGRKAETRMPRSASKRQSRQRPLRKAMSRGGRGVQRVYGVRRAEEAAVEGWHEAEVGKARIKSVTNGEQ